MNVIVEENFIFRKYSANAEEHIMEVLKAMDVFGTLLVFY